MTRSTITITIALALITGCIDPGEPGQDMDQDMGDLTASDGQVDQDSARCSAANMPSPLGDGHVEILAHSCIVDHGVADCCIAARAPAGTFADIDFVSMLGPHDFGDDALGLAIDGMPALWASEGETRTGSISWDLCALPAGDARVAVHLLALDPDPSADSSGKVSAYRVIELGNVGSACN